MQKVDDPDEIKILELEQTTLPLGEYKEDGFESRQVFGIDIWCVVTEYSAEVLVDQFGNRFTASFPKMVTKAVQR